MWHALEWLLDKTDRKRQRAEIDKALALNLRGEARNDGLEMTSLCSRLEIEWRARDIHPWDRGLTLEQRAAMFVEQCLSDADAAIMRLFDKLPWVDIIDVSVLDRDSDEKIMAGTVYRPEPAKEIERSAGMRVKDLGLNYRVRGWEFESLKPEAGDRWPDSAAASNSASRLSSSSTRSPLRPRRAADNESAAAVHDEISQGIAGLLVGPAYSVPGPPTVTPLRTRTTASG